MEIELELENNIHKKSHGGSESDSHRRSNQEPYYKEMLIVNYDEPEAEFLEFKPVKERQVKRENKIGEPLPTLRPQNQVKKVKAKSKSKPKKNKVSLTPIVETNPSKILIPTIKEKAFYHDICKRPVDTLKGRTENELKIKSPSRRMVKSRSVPKLKDNFYDKKVEFYVKMCQKLEKTTYKPNAQQMTSDTMLKSTQKVQGLKETISRYNNDNANVKASLAQKDERRVNTRNEVKLNPDQFCKFCDNYFHEKCFDNYYKQNK